MAAKWITLTGKAETKNGIITYIPTKIKDKQGKDIVQFATVASNIEFENGTIKFNLKLLDKTSRCQVVFNSANNQVHVGINTNQYLFGIIKFNGQQFDNLSVTGSPENLNIDEEIEVKIEVFGSGVYLYIDEVLVATAYTVIDMSPIELFFTGYEGNNIVVSNIKVEPVKPRAFIVMQFTNEYNELYEEVIRPVCENHGLDCYRADEFYTSTPILADIISSIKECTIIIADITENNPNVFYELGYAHAVDKPTILLCERKRDKLPFDISSYRTIFYDNTISGKTKVEKNLKKFLENML
ncbi:MAG: hypothetical protein Q7W45_10595 [Bacteroidota bacterium]|nr:hypothetical protein [Bacteroidota bacterium]MDP3146096.1 hypothetical protein [Bacteroidota bacterium]